MSDLYGIIGYVFIFIGLGFDIIGCIGLIRLPDVYCRLQSVVKCVTFGTCMILVGAIVIKGFAGTGVKALVCLVFLLLTAPTAAHALSKGAHVFGIKQCDRSVCDKYEEDKNRD